MWRDMFYSATITLVPPVTLVLHGLLPLHPVYNIHVLLHNTYDKYCCSCKNYRGKGMEGEQKVSLRCFGADPKIASS